MLYELITVTRPKRPHEAKEIARATGTIILTQRGVIRSLANWGQSLLPKPVQKNMERHDFGHSSVMRFDCAPATQAAVRKMLKVDPRVLRFGLVKLGDGTLKSGMEYTDVEWTKRIGEERALRRSGPLFAGRR